MKSVGHRRNSLQRLQIGPVCQKYGRIVRDRRWGPRSANFSLPATWFAGAGINRDRLLGCRRVVVWLGYFGFGRELHTGSQGELGHEAHINRRGNNKNSWHFCHQHFLIQFFKTWFPTSTFKLPTYVGLEEKMGTKVWRENGGANGLRWGIPTWRE